MSEYRVFPNAPIKEAIIDIQVQVPDGTNLEDLERIHTHVKDTFPEKTQRISYQASLNFSQNSQELQAPSVSTSRPDGYLFRSAENTKVFQARFDGFTFNKMRPYENWANFVAEAEALWRIYCQEIKPIIVKRVGLRYVNRILLPAPSAKLEEFLLTRPEISPAINKPSSGFFMQVALPLPEINATAIITQTIENEETENIPYIFDIDVFSTMQFPTDGDSLWPYFEKLKDAKNFIFFKSITEKTEELFK